MKNILARTIAISLGCCAVARPSTAQSAERPPNPLVITQPAPQLGQGAAPADYRRDSAVATPPAAKNLPLFGYDFFQPARDIIDARRAYLRRVAEGAVVVNSQPAPEKAVNTDQTRRRQPADGVQSKPEVKPQSERPVNAFEAVADPLTQLSRNVLASVPPSYQLAPGDTLTIRYWSPRLETRSVTTVVDAQGVLPSEDLGGIVVRGLTLEQAEKLVRAQLRRLYKDADSAVTLGKMRTIQVTVSGAVYQPGSYAVPAVATAYNLLYAAGGPSPDGTMRQIEVRRQGRIAGTIDLYRYLLTGQQAADVPLQDGDLIYIPNRRTRVAASGEVGHAAFYELAEGERLSDLLGYAGGVKSSGVSQRLRINTLVPGSSRVLKDIDLAGSSAGATTLYDGDDVEVFSLRPELSNSVSIEGAVDQPSQYALAPGMHVSDLLVRARGLRPDAYTTRADLFRWNPDGTTTLMPVDLGKAMAHEAGSDFELSRWDRLKVYSRQEVGNAGRHSVTVRGAVQRPGIYEQSANMRVSDLLRMAGGVTADAYTQRAMLLHQRGDGSFGMDFVRLANATDDPALHDNDVLAVYRAGEAQFEPEHAVSIHGEVVSPGSYPRAEGMKLSDLLALSGGLKPGAAGAVTVAHARRVLEAAEQPLQTTTSTVANGRLAGSDVVLEDGDVITVPMAGGYVEHVQIVNVVGAVAHPGPVVLTRKGMRLSDAISAAGGLRPEAFPQGAEFYRIPTVMTSAAQRTLADSIGKLNDLINDQAYSRERGRVSAERLKAAASPSADSAAASLNGASAANPAAVAALAAQQPAHEPVSPARKLEGAAMEPSGAVSIDLASAVKRPGGSADLLLLDGDKVVVPERPTTVQVVGAVFANRGVPFRADANLDYYVTQSGGYAPDAARDRIEVIHLGGGLMPAQKVREILPGDVIVVPTRVMAERINGHRASIDSVFRSLTSSAIIFRLATGLFGL